VSKEGAVPYEAQISAKALRRAGGLLDVLAAPSPGGKKVDEIRVAVPLTVVEEHRDASGVVDFVKVANYAPPGEHGAETGWVPYSAIEKK